MKTYKPVALIILDGWGLRGKEEGNAVALANTPNYDQWTRTLERSVLDASGAAVGLPDGQMGNSEVGHLNLGAGRVVYQDLTRINLAITDDSFNQMTLLLSAIENVKQNGSKLHLIGLFGSGGVHSHSDHLYALLDLANDHDIEPILHLITDGRDTPPQSSLDFLTTLEAYQVNKNVTVASVSGRYHTMDRDKRWPRTEKGYRVIALHEGENEGETAPAPSRGQAVSARAAIQQAHANGITDEFIEPIPIDTGDKKVTIQPNDSVIFYNFRADRMRQLVTAFTDEEFDGFKRPFIRNLNLYTMTEYSPDYPVNVIFPNIEINNVLAEVISNAGLNQFHAAETEKYAHVTYFFNGGNEQINPGEERYLEPSPKVATYDLQPEMSANELTAAIIKRVEEEDDAFILVNYANPDMVGHTGVLEAAIKAVETVDGCAARLIDTIVKKGGVALVTADHGNCDRMLDHKTGDPHTYHTTQPVTLFVIGYDGYVNLCPRGILADVAPTVLALMGLPQPPEMSGNCLIK